MESQYLKLKEGKNVFRFVKIGKNPILIRGLERWYKVYDENGNPVFNKKRQQVEKPVRVEIFGTNIVGGYEHDEFPEGLEYRLNDDGTYKEKEFIAGFVYHYDSNLIKLFVNTTKSIIGYLKNKTQEPKFSQLSTYDLIITRRGTGETDTEYTCEVDKEITKECAEALADAVLDAQGLDVDLYELYRGGDPFNPKNPRYEPKAKAYQEKKHQAKLLAKQKLLSGGDTL